MKHVSATILLFLLVAVTAFDPAADFCHDNGGVCLSSFIWCDSRSPPRCAWPDKVDPLVRDSSPYGVIYRGYTYNITWSRALEDRPVIAEWWSEVRGVDGLTRLWSTNTTSDSIKFDPESILNALSASNVTMEQIIYGTEGPNNFIKISQPQTSYPAVTSQQFAVLGDWTAQFALNMREEFQEDMAGMERRWRLGVGIGVGIGVPALMGLTWFLASQNHRTAVAKSAK